MNKIRQFLNSLTMALLIFFSSPIHSDDTEIYLGNNNTGGVKPNVLFVLDTSSSMTSEDGTGITRLQRMKTALNQILDQASNINVGLMRFHGQGGPVLYPIADIDADASVVEGEENSGGSVNSRISSGNDDAEEASGAVLLDSNQLELVKIMTGTSSLERRVSNNSDDAEEVVSSGSIGLSSTDLELIRDGSNQYVGIRFRNITIPQNATIQSAEIEFEIDEQYSESTSLDIYGQLALNPSIFSSSNGDISSRTVTTNSISWSNLPNKSVDEKLTTPDISTVVQEIIDQSGWSSSGNSMVFILTGSGRRTVESHNGESGAAPLLRINYTTGSTGESVQTVGLRFQNVGVPQGATITNATIEFEAAVSKSEVTSLTLKGENNDDSSAFDATGNNISSRTKTLASVSWDNIPAWTEGSRYQTSDITTIIQEIVNRSGWCGNNALSLIIEGTGLRNAQSFEGSAAGAPLLSIEYDEDSVSEGACINQAFQSIISSSADDAEEASDGSVNTSSSDLEMVQEASTQTIGLRFRNINIPSNTTILEASLEFTVDETNSGATSLTIKGEKSADAAYFSSTGNNITGRPQTTASVSWSPSSWDTVGDKKQSVDIKTIIQEIVNQGTWNSGNALALLVSGSGKRVADSYDGGASNAAVLKVKIQGQLGTGDKTVRSRLKDIVDEINWKSGTPLVDTLFEAALYYRGNNMVYGNTRGNSIDSSASLSRSEYTRVSHPASYTGGTVVRSAGCTDATLNSSDCVSEQITGTATYKSPIALSCQGNHIILLSDGYPSRNSSVSGVESLIGSSCSGSGSGKCGEELTEFLYTQDQKSGTDFDGDQNIKTHTIGFNVLSGGKAYLEGLASKGGAAFYPASSSADLVDAFQSIIGEIISHPSTFAAPSLSVNSFNRLYHNNEVYYSLFLPTKNQRWVGNLKKYKVEVCAADAAEGCEDKIVDVSGNSVLNSSKLIKDTAQSFWSSSVDGGEIAIGGAGENIPNYSARRLFTYTGSTAPDNVTLNNSSHEITLDNNLLTKTLLGESSMTDDDRTKLINWIKGKDVNDEDGDGDFDENRWIFSDPLHGGSTTISYGQQGTGDDKVQISKVLIPGNDGTLRMVNGSTGVEEWAFIPSAMLSKQKELMVNIEGDHIYGLDNTVTTRYYDANQNGIIEPTGTDANGDGTVQDDEKDYVHVYVSMRRGGRNIYALNITPSSTITNNSTTNSISPKLLWRINGGSGDFTKLGQTWSKPFPAKVSVKEDGSNSKREVLIFAGGYHPGQDDGFGTAGYGNAIYIVDALTGVRLMWVSDSDSGADLQHADMQYAIPSDLELMDSDNSGTVDRIYVGDTGGQLWRLDIGLIDLDLSSTSSVISKLASVSDRSADADVSKQRKFFYPPDIAQIEESVFSNTALYDLVSIISGNRAHPLDTTVHDRIYAFRDTRIRNSDSAISTIVDNSVKTLGVDDDLFDATNNLIQQGTDEQIATAKVDIKGKKGWFIDLKEYDNSWVGEKGLSSPLILDGKLFFTTYVPGLAPEDPCSPMVEGGGRLYAVDLITGGAVYDWYGGTSVPEDGDETEDSGGTDPNFTKEDRRYDDIGGGIPSEPKADFDEEGVRVVVDKTVIDPNVGLPRSRTFWMQQGLE